MIPVGQPYYVWLTHWGPNLKTLSAALAARLRRGLLLLKAGSAMPFNRFGGRSMARYSNNADVWGRLAERRLDLPAESPKVRLSEHEYAEAEFAGLTEEKQGQLLGFLASQIQPDTARIGTQRGGLQNVIWSDDLAGQATAALGWAVNIRALNGALLKAGYLPTRRTSAAAVWAVGGLPAAFVQF